MNQLRRAMDFLVQIKGAVDKARSRQVNLVTLIINPMTVPFITSEASEWGIDFYNHHRVSFFNRFLHRLHIRRLDPRPRVFGIPIEINPTCPPNVFLFSSDEESRVAEVEDAINREGIVSYPQAAADIKTPTDIMIRAMEGMDGCDHIVVLRFFDQRMEFFTNFNQLELQAVLQKAAILVLQKEE